MADLKKLGIKLLYLPIDYRALVERINVTFDYECALMGLGGGGGDPASQMNVLRSSEDLHQWFPLQKTPSTDWEARIDTLMDAQMRTLDFAQRKKDFDEVQVILAEELPMIYTVAPFATRRHPLGRRQPPPRRPEPLPPDLESGGAVFQEEVTRATPAAHPPARPCRPWSRRTAALP